ncbi:hypothetical protein ACTQ3J_01560 [Oscillospiraceae bacterium LCP25S3_E3]
MRANARIKKKLNCKYHKEPDEACLTAPAPGTAPKEQKNRH